MKAKQVNESMHPLETPVFAGTSEEMINAVSYWVEMVTLLRNMTSVATTYENRNAILNQLEVELGAIRSELENVSAVLTRVGDGSSPQAKAITMAQPKTDKDEQPVQAKDTVVDLSVAESRKYLQKLAGIEQHVDPLSEAVKRFRQ